jgi:hypothetical protein
MWLHIKVLILILQKEGCSVVLQEAPTMLLLA